MDFQVFKDNANGFDVVCAFTLVWFPAQRIRRVQRHLWRAAGGFILPFTVTVCEWTPFYMQSLTPDYPHATHTIYGFLTGPVSNPANTANGLGLDSASYAVAAVAKSFWLYKWLPAPLPADVPQSCRPHTFRTGAYAASLLTLRRLVAPGFSVSRISLR